MPPICQSHCKLQFLWRSQGAKLCKALCCHMKLPMLCGFPILLIGKIPFFLVEKVLWWSSGRSFSIILPCKTIGFWTKMIGWLLQFQQACMGMLCQQLGVGRSGPNWCSVILGPASYLLAPQNSDPSTCGVCLVCILSKHTSRPLFVPLCGCRITCLCWFSRITLYVS